MVHNTTRRVSNPAAPLERLGAGRVGRHGGRICRTRRVRVGLQRDDPSVCLVNDRGDHLQIVLAEALAVAPALVGLVEPRERDAVTNPAVRRGVRPDYGLDATDPNVIDGGVCGVVP